MRHTFSGKKKKVNYWTSTKKVQEFKEYTPNYSYARGDTSHIKSVETGRGGTPLPERKVYTGTLIKGISTMHKSNAVPIIDEQEAKDHALMRR
jgi:hypothetical protein